MIEANEGFGDLARLISRTDNFSRSAIRRVLLERPVRITPLPPSLAVSGGG